MKKQLRILILEDDDTDAELMKHELRKGNIAFESRCVETREAFEKSLDDFAPDLILADYTLPAFDGRSALRISNERLPDVPFIFVSGTIGEDFAIESLKSGATDYVLKDRMSRLAPAVDRALREAEEKIEYKKAEKALKDSELRFRSVVQSANDAIILTDGRGNIISWNKGAEAIFSYTEKEVLGKPIIHIMPQRYRDRHQEKLEYVNLVGKSDIIGKTVESYGLRKNGSEFPLEISTATWNTEEGIFYSAIIRDITERKRAEDTLKRSHDLLNSVSNVQSRFITDSDTQVIFDNLLSNLLSLTRSEYGFIGEVLYNAKGEPYLKTHAVTNIAWNEDTRKFYEDNIATGMEFHNLKTIFGAVMTTGEPVIANNPIKDARRGGLPKGHPLLNSFLGVPFYQGGELVGMAGIANRPGGYDEELVEYLQPLLNTCANIIEAYRNNQRRKQVEEELRIQARLLDDATDSIFVHDLDGNFIYINEGAYKSRGFNKEEIMGMNLHEIVIPEYERLLKSRFNKLIEDRDGTFESAHFRKDKSVMPVEAHARIIESGGKKLVLSVIRDITERKRAEEALQQSEEKYRMLIDNMQDGIFILQDGKIQFVNESFARTAGYSVGEVLGRDFLDFIASEDKERVVDNYSRRLAGENIPKEYELNVLHKDGTRIITNVNVGLIKYRDKPASMGTIKDITERKRAEKALQYRLDFEKLITSISTNFINITSDEIDRAINRALEAIGKFTGVDRSYVFMVSGDGTKIDNTHEWCADQDCSQLRNLKGLPFDSFPWFAGKMRMHETISISRIADMPPDASVEIAALQKSPIKSLIDVPMVYGGVLFGYLGLTSVHKELTWSEDLTALLKIVGEIFVNALVRKMAEAALWESESRFRAIFEEAAIGMVLVNTDGHAIVSNPALQEMLGYSGEELREMTFTDFTHPDDVSDNLRLFRELVAGKRDYYQMEKRYIKKDSRIIWVRLTSSLVRGDGGEPRFSIGMVEDITEHKKTEELLKEKARAELYGFIVSALPVFASNIPSQVRNILVKNFAMRFESNIRPRFKEEMKQLSINTGSGMHNEFDVFMLWLAGLFSNLGIKTRTAPGRAKRSFELLNCPWRGEASGNPVFCLICRTIVMRSLTWTPLKGMAEQKSSIANGSQTCMFEINVNQRHYQGDH